MKRWPKRRTLLVAAGFVVVVLLVAASRAHASGVLGSGIGPEVGPQIAPNVNPLPSINPFPSVSELLRDVIGGLFGALLSALTPGFLKHADIHALQWLVALPNPADTSASPAVARLEQDMVWVAGALLPTTLIIATLRDSAMSLAFRAHPANALMRFTGAVFALVLYRFTVSNVVAFVNTLTDTMLSWQVVAQGLHRTVLVMFGGSLLVGAGGAFLALLGVIALVFAVLMFALKVFLFEVLRILFVSGPLFIGVTPLPTVGYLARGWLLALVGVCLIPVGWCIIFATAGAMSVDVTSLSGGLHIEGRVLGAFAGLATFYLAYKWPLLVLGHVRGAMGGLGVSMGSAGGGGGGGGGGVSDGVLAARAQRAKTRLQAAAQAGGRGLGSAAGQLGAPKGGLVGMAGPPRVRPAPAPGSQAERMAKAGDTLRETPGQMREAWRAAGSKPPAAGGQPSQATGAAAGPQTAGDGRQQRRGQQGGHGGPRGAKRMGAPTKGAGAVPPPGAPASGATGAGQGAKGKNGGAGGQGRAQTPRPPGQPGNAPVAAGQGRGAGRVAPGAPVTRSASGQAGAPARPPAGSDAARSPRAAGRAQPKPSAPNQGQRGTTPSAPNGRRQRTPRKPPPPPGLHAPQRGRAQGRGKAPRAPKGKRGKR